MKLAGRLFLTHRSIQAAVLSLTSVSLAWLLWSLAPSTFTTLERGWYDTWLRARDAQDASPQLLVVVRDDASEHLFGNGLWDRAVIARMVSALQDAGAAAIGLDIPLTIPSPPTQGGAASDALLLEAVRSAGAVVYSQASPFLIETPLPPPPLPSETGQPAAAHMITTLDPDRVVRRIPLFTEVSGRVLPAFALRLAATSWRMQPEQIRRERNAIVFLPAGPADESAPARRIPTDQHGDMLVNFAGHGSIQAFERVGFAELWDHLEQKRAEELERRAHGTVVVLLSQPPWSSGHLSPFGSDMSDSLVQLHALNTLLTGRWIEDLPAGAHVSLAFVLALVIGWSLLSGTALNGLALAVGVLGLYLGLAVAMLNTLQWVMPVTIPVTAAAGVMLSVTLLDRFLSARRVALLEADMLHVQQELVSVREALVCRENAVDALGEDLVMAHQAVSSSVTRQQDLLRTVEGLRGQMADAQELEDAARGRLEELERQLTTMRTAASVGGPLGNAEQEQLRHECGELGIITRHARLLELFRDLKKGARATVTVLITGEPGTGKELFARAVHRLSPRAANPFIAVNMAAISPELFESELFGHVRGSFTGALADRRGFFEQAHRGTIFLDEIGDLRLDHQSKLLRVLQDRTFYRVGATSPTTVDVRIVAATNKDLQRGVSEGWFREDLYFRLTGLILHLPPLRDRPEDIPALAAACLQEAAAQHARGRVDLSQEAVATLSQQPWKGNVRELRHCIEQAAALCDGPMITTGDLRLQTRPLVPTSTTGLEPLLPDPAGDAAVLALLRQHTFDMQATAQALGWDRSTVTQRLKGLCFQALVDSGGDQAKAAVTIAGDPALLRTVELKVMDYYGRLVRTIEPFTRAEDALLDCKRRFKNLPDRHFKFVEVLVRQYFGRKPEASSPQPSTLPKRSQSA